MYDADAWRCIHVTWFHEFELAYRVGVCASGYGAVELICHPCSLFDHWCWWRNCWLLSEILSLLSNFVQRWCGQYFKMYGGGVVNILVSSCKIYFWINWKLSHGQSKTLIWTLDDVRIDLPRGWLIGCILLSILSCLLALRHTYAQINQLLWYWL